MKKIKEYIEYGKDLKYYLDNPSFRIINANNLENNVFSCKYGAFGVTYHEIGIVNSENPFYLVILTQKYEKKEKDKFINDTAKSLMRIHKMVEKFSKNIE